MADRTITISKFGLGFTDPATATVLVAEGGSSTVSFSPFEGSRVYDVLVDSVSVGDVTSYTFTGVTADHLVEVFFTQSFVLLESIDQAQNLVNPLSPSTGGYHGVEASGWVSPADGNMSRLRVSLANDFHSLSVEVLGSSVVVTIGTWDTGLGAITTQTASYPYAGSAFKFTLRAQGLKATVIALGMTLSRDLNVVKDIAPGWKTYLRSIGKNPGPSGAKVTGMSFQGDDGLVTGQSLVYQVQKRNIGLREVL